MDIKKMLDYQKKDGEIVELQKELQRFKETDVVNQIKATVKQTQNISAGLEDEASAVYKAYMGYKKEYDNAAKKLKEYGQLDVAAMDVEDRRATLKKVNSISNLLKNLEKKMERIIENVDYMLKEFTKAKNQYKNARIQHVKYKEQYQKLADDITPRIDEIKEELAEMEKGINEKLLAKYKACRRDIYPVLVPLKGNVCGRCGMELPSAQVEKLQDSGFLTCENCHRIIYFAE